GNAQDQLVMVVDSDNDGRAPGAAPGRGVTAGQAAGLIVLPDGLSGGLVSGEEELAFARATPEDDEVVVEGGRRGVAPDVLELAELFAPQLLTFEIVTDHAGRAEAGDDSFAVGHRRGGTVRVGVMGRLLAFVGGLLLPEELAVGAVEAHDGAAGTLVEGLSEE